MVARCGLRRGRFMPSVRQWPFACPMEASVRLSHVFDHGLTPQGSCKLTPKVFRSSTRCVGFLCPGHKRDLPKLSDQHLYTCWRMLLSRHSQEQTSLRSYATKVSYHMARPTFEIFVAETVFAFQKLLCPPEIWTHGCMNSVTTHARSSWGTLLYCCCRQQTFFLGS